MRCVLARAEATAGVVRTMSPVSGAVAVCARPQVVCVPLADVPGVKAGALIFLHVSHLLFDWAKLSSHQSNTALGVLRRFCPSAWPHAHTPHRRAQPTRPYELLSDIRHVKRADVRASCVRATRAKPQ